ncbi:F-box protein At3g07870-like [Andrographis paniculata]|uniref:F-box protein At3g07870-like n=1 Tax=Andrographis paniculata TaxID=175694 RepID=UPI0021E6DF8D|nr:F-box protein At3g07870-like [Andrographis paniculata]
MDELTPIHGNDPKPVDESKGLDCLPVDLIVEILTKLPPKILCRCRCVSKSWYSLLTHDVEFMSRHVELSKRRPLLLVRRYLSDGISGSEKIAVELTSIDMQGDITDKFQKVIDGPVHTFLSCGPLSILCCMDTLYLCNPGIRQVVRVPRRSNSRLYNVGFGYLPVSKEYKIVHMFYHSDAGNGKMGCEIFSFRQDGGVKAGAWRTVGDCPFIAWTDEQPVCVNGIIYWALSSGWKNRSILSFDMENEEFGSISYPIHESKDYSFLEYVGLMEALCVVGFSASSMDIWVLKNNRGFKTWAMEYSIDLFPFCPKFLVPSYDQSEEILVHMEQRDLFCYNLKSRKARRVEYYRAMKNYNKPCLYYASMVSVLGHGSGS